MLRAHLSRSGARVRPTLNLIQGETSFRYAGGSSLEVVPIVGTTSPYCDVLDMTSGTITLRPVSQGDGESLAELRVVAMRESLEAVGRFDPERARSRFLSGFVPEYTREILVDGMCVGFVVVRPLDDELLLDHLYIAPAAQGRGIGSQVLAVVFAEADLANQNIRVGALKQSRSNLFYLRHGFEFVSATDWDNYYVRRPGGG